MQLLSVGVGCQAIQVGQPQVAAAKMVSLTAMHVPESNRHLCCFDSRLKGSDDVSSNDFVLTGVVDGDTIGRPRRPHDTSCEIPLRTASLTMLCKQINFHILIQRLPIRVLANDRAVTMRQDRSEDQTICSCIVCSNGSERRVAQHAFGQYVQSKFVRGAFVGVAPKCAHQAIVHHTGKGLHLKWQVWVRSRWTRVVVRPAFACCGRFRTLLLSTPQSVESMP